MLRKKENNERTGGLSMSTAPINDRSNAFKPDKSAWGDGQLIAVVGLGYVGLPLAVAFGRKLPTIGFDIDARKLEYFRAGRDPTGEATPEALKAAVHLEYTSDPERLRQADAVVVAVPTPIDDARRPDLGPLIRASETVGRHLKAGAVVVYESTVYPGCTEEVCIPILERESGLAWAGRDTAARRDSFHVGYSPERINPGDRAHRLETIVKVVSGDDPATLERVAGLYETVVEVGVHRASSIRVAEAAKVIENTQRDLNIALMNELAVLFNRLGIDTAEVLAAAGTKWNFLPFRPGLVGGHCIGVDPYYLTYKAEQVGHHPDVILAGRRINDSMGKYIAEQTVKQLIQTGACVNGARISILGLTFKEDCPDLRNSRVPDIIHELETYGCRIAVHDPLADPEEAQAEYGVALQPWDDLQPADALVVAVAHSQYKARSVEDYTARLKPGGCLMDIKCILEPSDFVDQGVCLWRL
jgi:UDP-N-acetyl-D-glucosamine/UDP-N-acetyl-D-galactosamine dehydrogenase